MGRRQARSRSRSEAKGARTVLTLESYADGDEQSANEEQWAREEGLTLLRIPMSPVLKPTVDSIEKSLAVINDVHNQPIVVHCQYGSDRTGIVVAAYRMVYEHMTYEKAKAEMKSYGHSVWLSWWDDVLLEVKAF